MPIAKITTDYTGRTKDINIFPAINPTIVGPQKVNPSFGNVSSYCAGVQKLVQRYAVALLTVQGSQPNYPNFGTALLKTLMVSSLTTQSDLSHAFNFANAIVVSQFRNYQKDAVEVPLDEQLDTATLLSVTVSPGYDVTYRIAIYTNAGTTYDFLLPIPVTI